MKKSILGLMYLIQGMRHIGLDVDTRLAHIGIHANALDPSAKIIEEIEQDILKQIMQDIAPEQGLIIGQHYTLMGYGPFLMLLLSSANIQQALYNGIKFQKLTYLSGRLAFNIQSQHIVLTYQAIDLETTLGQLKAQCEVSATYKFLHDIFKMMGLDVPHIQVKLPFSQPNNRKIQKIYQDYYGLDVEFDAAQTYFILENDQLMKKRIPSANAFTYRIYEKKCRQDHIILNNQSNDQFGIIGYIETYLSMQNGITPTMAEIAYVLKTPERTLRHQLQQMQSSYKQIKDRYMKQKAIQLIQKRAYSIEQVAQILGYAEPSAFNHAFKRWFKQSPRQYRKQYINGRL